MSTCTQVFHTGKKWIEVAYSPILNEEGNPTGHYEELSRRQIIVFGIFDDKDTLLRALENINVFRNSMRNRLYQLSGFKDETIIYQAYSANEAANSLSNEVIQYLKDKNLVILEHIPYNPADEKSSTIIFKGYIREQEGEEDCPIYTIKLSCLDKEVTQVI